MQLGADTMGAGHYPGSHGGEPSTLPLNYLTIPNQNVITFW